MLAPHPLHQPAVGNGLPHSWGEDGGVPEHLGHLSTGGSWCQGPPSTAEPLVCQAFPGHPQPHAQEAGLGRVRAEPERALPWMGLPHLWSCCPPAWCLRNEGVSSVLLGASSADQLMENIGAIQVSGGRQPCRRWAELRVSASHLSSTYLLSTYYIPDTVQGTWATAVNHQKALLSKSWLSSWNRRKTLNVRNKIIICVGG